MPTFEAGVALGQALSTLREHDGRISHLEVEVRTLKGLAMRVVLLLVLGLGAVGTNMSAATVGEFTASFLRAWSK